MLRNFITVVCMTMVLILFVTATSVLSQLADSPWPMLHQGRGLTSLTSQRGPEQDVQLNWSLPFGWCWGNISQGSDEYLYLAIEEADDGSVCNTPNQGDRCHYLYKLNPASGATAASANLGHFTGENDKLVASVSPAIVKISTTDWVYTQESGKIRKWSTSLVEQTGSWPVSLQQSGVNLLPTGVNLSRNGDTLIVAAGENLSNSSKLLIYATEKGNGTSTTFNLYNWVSQRRCATQACVNLGQCSLGSECFYYPETSVTTNNMVAIGPDPADPTTYDLVYVLVREKYLFAIKFHQTNKTWGSMKWKFQYSPHQSDTAPTVSADGNRVYIASGSVPGSTSTLYSIRTSDGVSVAESNFDVKKVTGSPAVETVNGKNRIYIQSDGSLMGFEDDLQSSTLSCSWMNEDTITIMIGNAGKSVGTGQSGTGLLYAGYKVSGTRYAAGFDTDAQWSRGSCPVTRGGTAVWSIQTGTETTDEDVCSRAVSKIDTAGQAYYGTHNRLRSYEEGQ